ncbi:MAG: ABC transporter ATP-binding protein [Acidimicrobiia bacterium]|nr:ABC transporter ATP-binding protein [Acidimicrobiia bacterium]
MPADTDSLPPFVTIEGLTKTFDQLVALDSVSMDLAPGEVHALLGENGAGKTTLTNVLAGIYRADSGVVTIGGETVHFRTPADAIHGGVGMVHQHFQLVPTMTVSENLFMGWEQAPRVFSTADLNERSAEIIEEFHLPVDPSARIFELSVGEQQRVEIVRTLARGAKLLILDEPTAVLTHEETEELFTVLRRLADGGRTIIFISHKLKEVLEIADRITVLRAGKYMATIPAQDATVDSLAQLMTGSDVSLDDIEDIGPAEVGEQVLEVRDLHALSSRGLPALRGVDLTVRSGEIVGIAGVSGNGQTELAEIIVGIREGTSGSVRVTASGTTEPPIPGQDGVGHIPEDRMEHALVGEASTTRNAVTRRYLSDDLSSRRWLRWGAIREYAKQVIEDGRVQVREVNAPVAQLSGGNQQRLVATREAKVGDDFLLAVHPTRGLDVQATVEVRQTLQRRRRGGTGVLLISDDLDEVLAMSDRIVVMYDGEILGRSDRANYDRDQIGLLMGGHREAANT